HVADPSGNTADASWQTAVDTRLPGHLVSPLGGAVLTGTAGFVFAATPGVHVTNVSVGCLGSASAPDPDGVFRASGDTNTCANGTQSLAAGVSFTDSFGETHSWSSPSVSVTIDNPVTARILNTSERSFSPNGDQQEDTIFFWYCLSR